MANNTITHTQESKTNMIQNIVTEDSISALDSALDVVKKEYGNFKLTKKMRHEFAKELGETEETADSWQTVVDILDHIDINELAKKHPEAIGKVSKTIINIVSFFCPAVSTAKIVPDEFLIKIVECADVLTPEHLINIIAKKQVEKNKAKREQQQSADTGETQESKDKGLKNKFTEVYKSATGSISGLLSRKSPASALPQSEDILDTIKNLSELKNCDAITQEEFESKKAELLEKL